MGGSRGTVRWQPLTRQLPPQSPRLLDLTSVGRAAASYHFPHKGKQAGSGTEPPLCDDLFSSLKNLLLVVVVLPMHEGGHMESGSCFLSGVICKVSAFYVHKDLNKRIWNQKEMKLRQKLELRFWPLHFSRP